MSWLFFGDDWGRHPSTSQHLARALVLSGERVDWINSLGMRSPSLSALNDWRRLSERLKPRARSTSSEEVPERGRPARVNSAPVLPWHHHRATRALSAAALKAYLNHHLELTREPRPIIISATPVLALYAHVLPAHATLIYLRLDDYAHLPGVDPELIKRCEPLMYHRASLIAAPCRELLSPAQALDRPCLYLPQGVDLEHFQQLPMPNPAATRRTLGFFGLLAPWLDLDLIVRLAKLKPDWDLEFIGARDPALERALAPLPNVLLRDAVPYHELPSYIRHWSAAWLPFAASALTHKVNPLKLREYLACGLPTLTTEAMPEAMLKHVDRASDPAHISRWLEQIARGADREALRAQRRLSVSQCSWEARAQRLLDALNV